MDKIPRVSLEPIEEMARGYQISKILFTAMELEVFTLLKEPKTAAQVSEELETNLNLTEKFLNTLTTLQLVSKMRGKYVNTKLAETFLTKDSTFYQGNYLKLIARGWESWSSLSQLLKNKNIPEEKMDETHIETLILGHADIAMSGALQRTVNVISSLPEFKNAKKLLDLGGGHGPYAIAFAELNPNLEVWVFDLPSVTNITKEFIEKHEMQGRVKVIAGDFTKDELGQAYDIIFVSDVTIFNILEKIYGALKADGVLIYRRWTINDDGTKAPLASVLLDFMMSARGFKHHICTLSEYISSFERIGFSITRIIDNSISSDPAKLIVAKKKA